MNKYRVLSEFLLVRNLKALCLTALIFSGVVWQSKGQIQGSFVSKFKRFSKGEPFTGSPALSDHLVAWKGERAYAQLMLWSAAQQANLSYEVSNFTSGSHTIDASNVTLLFAHNVKADSEARACGTYPQPRLLISKDITDALSFTPKTALSAADPLKIWVRLNVPATASPGQYAGTIQVKQGENTRLTFRLNLQVLNKTLPQRADWRFHLDLWQYPYQILKYYNENHPTSQVALWSDAHFGMFKPFYQLLADAGQKVVTAHISEKAIGQPSMIRWMKNADQTWAYDFTAFDKYVDSLAAWGISQQINAFSPAVEQITYFDRASQSVKELSTPIASEIYNARWGHFLTAFKSHLIAKGWFSKTVLYMDEVPEKLLTGIIQLVQSNDRNWKMGLAYFKPLSTAVNRAMYDISGNLGLSTSAGRASKISTFYTSCAQTIPNNYVTPENQPSEMNWMAWHVANQGLNGYLRWAYDNWTLNEPLDLRNGAHTSGDFSMVYRSTNELNAEVYSSYRLEHLRNGIQDYEKIRLLKNELDASTDVRDREALTLLNAKISQFHKNSGIGATTLVAQGEALINSIVQGTFTYCSVSGASTASQRYTQWVGATVNGTNSDLGNTWAGAYPGGYARYHGGKIEAAKGATLRLTVENTNNVLSRCARTYVWIDWNGDHDFSDAGERVLTGGIANTCNNPSSYTFSISVPTQAKVGVARMRIQVRDAYVAEPTPCGEATHASTRDFNLEVLDIYCKTTTPRNQSYFLRKLTTDDCAGSLNFENTTAPPNGYLHYTASAITAVKGAYFKLNLENTPASNCARAKIWMDWNGDHDFNDPGEEIDSLGRAQSCKNPTQYTLFVGVPSDAQAGLSRMRIQLRDAWLSPPTPCAVGGLAGTIDFNVQIANPATTPQCVPALISPLSETTLRSINPAFRWENNNLKVQKWRLKVTSTAAGQSATHYNQTFASGVRMAQAMNLPNDGRPLQVTLAWEVNGIWSSVSSTYKAFDVHCAVGGGTHTGYYVQKLNTNGAKNNLDYRISSAPKNYDYHQASRVVANEGTHVKVNLTPSPASNCARIKAWIDWNGDHDFEDTGEEVYTAGNAQSCQNPYTHTFTIQVPKGQPGVKRIRIQLRDAWLPEPVACGVFNFTGTLDLEIEVRPQPAHSPPHQEKVNKTPPALVSIRAFPNPTSGRLYLTLRNHFKGQLRVRLLNVVNQAVPHAQWTENKKNPVFERSYDLRSLQIPNGVYLLEVTTAQGQRWIKRILLEVRR